MNDCGELFSNINFVLKLVEFCICLAALIFMYVDEQISIMHSAKHDLIPVATWGYGCVTLCILIAYIFDETHDLLEISLTIFGAIFNLLAGVFIFIYHGKYGDSMSGSASFFWILLGILTLACAAVCIVDLIFKFRDL